jgi:hypothetical protein
LSNKKYFSRKERESRRYWRDQFNDLFKEFAYLAIWLILQKALEVLAALLGSLSMDVIFLNIIGYGGYVGIGFHVALRTIKSIRESGLKPIKKK